MNADLLWSTSRTGVGCTIEQGLEPEFHVTLGHDLDFYDRLRPEQGVLHHRHSRGCSRRVMPFVMDNWEAIEIRVVIWIVMFFFCLFAGYPRIGISLPNAECINMTSGTEISR